MRFIGDLHIHSHFSRATSKQLIPEYLDYWARLKGISVVGTGDYTHPGWLKELREKLEPAEPGVFRIKDKYKMPLDIPRVDTLSPEVRFILSTEISSIYKKKDQVRKVHNVLLAPDFDTVDKIRQALARLRVNLTSDGRPILGLDAKDVLQIGLDASEDIYFVPAHIWTPWFSVLGSKSGFDSIEECFEDLASYITAVETGLSTDAPVNWMCSFLDRFTLVSNSDAHSPEKMGRNANIFDTGLNYPAIINAMKTGDPERFLGTIDLFPQEGKYHYDGHRKCGVRWNPLQTIQHGGICPECGRYVTVGVMNRVAQLSDREDLSKRPKRLPFYSIIPLKEILSEIRGKGPASQKIELEYQSLIRKMGPELYILLEMPVEELQKRGDAILAEAVHRMRERRIVIQEGFDGEYGRIKVFREQEVFLSRSQKSLFSEGETLLSPRRKIVDFDLKEYQRLHRQKIAAMPSQLSLEESRPAQQKGLSLHELNAKQREAASHDCGPSLVLAGPGTGKTRTLVYRVAFLIQERNVSPENILVITFTNKAADELKERLAAETGGKKRGPLVTTFHAFGYSILKEHGGKIERPGNFSILDREDKQYFLEKMCGCPKKEVKALSHAITKAKQNVKLASEIQDPHGASLFMTYEAQLKKMNLFDLDDCIYQPVLLFTFYPDILDEYRGLFPWMLIDEYQDINFAQYRMIQLLMPHEDSNLCVAGDPNQAIYGFRGADDRFIRKFIKDYPKAQTYMLEQSYRCSDYILKASDHILKEKHLESGCLRGLQRGVKVIISPQHTDKSEAEFVARTIENIIGGVGFFSLDSEVSGGQEREEIKSLSDFAILCRIKRLIKPLEKALNDHSIPYQIIGETPFFQEYPVKSVIEILKWALNPEDSFLRKKIDTARITSGVDPQALSRSFQKKRVQEILVQIISQFFGKEKVGEEPFTHLIEFSSAFESDVDGFLRAVVLGAGVDTYRPGMESVALMTLHAAKGLEFKCVFLVGCEDGILPYSLFGDKADKDEERRLLYVGMTRAEKFLFLSHASQRYMMGKEMNLKRSSFLDNIEEELFRLEERKTPLQKKETQMKLFYS